MRIHLAYFYSLVICLICIQCRISEVNDLSGIKIALDYSNLNLLKNLNYTNLLLNKSFLPHALNLGNGGILGYQINLGNITVNQLNPPQIADVQPRDVDSTTPSIKISLKNIYVKLLCDYSVSISAFKDNGKQSAVEINITQFSLDLTFNKTSNYIKVNQILLELNNLEINFNGRILKALYWLIKYKVISFINTNVQSLSSNLENLLNNLSNSPILFNIDGLKIVGLNLTITEKPNLIFSQTSTKTKNSFSNPSIVKFLSEEKIAPLNLSNNDLTYRCLYFPNYWN